MKISKKLNAAVINLVAEVMDANDLSLNEATAYVIRYIDAITAAGCIIGDNNGEETKETYGEAQEESNGNGRDSRE